MEKKILHWFMNGQVGSSSKAMAEIALGESGKTKWGNVPHPHDPDDLNRCLLLLEQVPEIREHFPKIAESSPVWSVLIKHFDELAQLFFLEVGRNWSKGRSAPKTYERMRELITAAEVSK